MTLGRRLWSPGLLVVAVGVSLALASAPAAAAATCTDSWVGSDGDWFVASNWSTGAVPGPNDAVCITAPGTYTVSVPASPGLSDAPSGQAQADTLQLGGGSGVQSLVIIADNQCGDSTGTGGLEVFDHGGASTAASIGPSGRVELAQDMFLCNGVANGSYLRVDAGTLSNAGAISSDGGAISGAGVTSRTIEGSVVNAGGTITVAVDTNWIGSRFDNAGTIMLPGAASLAVPDGGGSTFVNDAGGAIVSDMPSGYLFVGHADTFQQGAGTAEFPGVSHPGAYPTVIIQGGTLAYTGTGPSDIEVRGQSTLTGDVPREALLAVECAGADPAVLHTSSFTNAGFIGLHGADPETCDAGRTLSVDSSAGPGTGTLNNTGEIEGYGTVAGNVDNSGGEITPGVSFADYSPCEACSTPGLITITRSLTQRGTLDMITNGKGAPYGQLSVQGAAFIDGTLNLLTNSSRVAPGDAYQVLTASSITGKFNAVGGGVDDSNDARYIPVYNATNVTVEVMKIPTLTVRLAGAGWGAVSSSPQGIDCDEGACAARFYNGQTVTLSATPAQSGPFEPNSVFAGWSGACRGTGRCTLKLDSDRSVTATFIVPRPPGCTLRLKSPRANPTLTAIAVCNKAARLKLTGAVTEWLDSSRRSRSVHFQLRPVTRTAHRGRATMLVINLPPPALSALHRGHREAIRLMLRATASGATGRVSTRQLPLRG